MTKKEIEKLQDEKGLTYLQELINTGEAWQLEGSVGREAMNALREGACILPTTSHHDYWGTRVPSIDEVKPGTTGSLLNAIEYWTIQGVKDELQQSN